MRFRIQLLLLLIFSVHLSGQIVPHAFLIEGETEACQGDSVVAYIQIVGGMEPYTVVISYTSEDSIILEDISSQYDLWLKPEHNTTYSISSVKDSEGTEGSFSGEISMIIYPVNPVQIIMDHTLYFKSDPAVPLVSDPTGATFKGNGVLGNIFYPAYAPPEGSPHLISCIYKNVYGCPAYDTIGVTVIYGKADVVLVSGEEIINIVCDEGADYEIRGSNQDGIAGLFALRRAGSGQFLSGYIVDEDSSDNMATFHPAGLTGTYELVYTYEMEGLEIPGIWQVNINDIESLTISGFPDVVCNGDDPYRLTPGNITADPGSVYTISGPGISGSQLAGYYFNPGADSVLSSEITVRMEYTSSNGCHAVVNKTVTNHFTPGLSFTYAPSCLSSSGGTVKFNNTSTGKYVVEQWVWDFGDPASGSLNHSNLEQPQHFYAIPGVKTVSLMAHTTDGCVVTREQDAILSDQPVADLTWLHDCYKKGQKISFLDRSVSTYSLIESLEWTFKTEEGLVLGVLESIHPEDTIRFPFTSQDNYLIQLKVWDQAGCFDQTTKELNLKPTIPVTTSGYRENFNGSSNAWTSGGEEQSSWAIGLPDFTGFETVPGDYAWYTDLPSGDSLYLEQSWVESPCFDFKQSLDPELNLDLMKSFRPGLDGAVLQYKEAMGNGWITLGTVGEGTNWYNLSDIANVPGGSSFGWGLDLFQPDSYWQKAKYTISELVGKTNIKFRIALASGSTTGIGNQGFAFDNFSISEDFRGSLLEHFTNSSLPASKSADDVVDEFAMDNRLFVVDIQYHTDYPGNDPMNENNPYPASTRSLQIGALPAPFALLNGSREPEFRYEFTGPSEEPDGEILQQIALESSPFQLSLFVDWRDEGLEATVQATCLAESFPSNVQLYVVVMETLVTAYTGENQDTEFRNVVLDMLPDPTGRLLGGDWTYGETVTKTFSWNYPGYVEDIEDLAVVAFVANRDDQGKILQVTANYLTPYVGMQKHMARPGDLAVYPNPATQMVYVNLGDQATLEGNMMITDLSGRRVMESEVLTGYAIFRLDVSSLPEGMYMINWVESGRLKGRSKLIRTR